jgi:hypothetical protein
MLKTVSSLGNLIGALVYKGTWDASSNTPTLVSSVGNKGDYYVVSVAGSTNLNGITDWKVSDIAVFNGSVWEKIDNTDAVLSVNGQTGAVVLTATDVGATPNTAYVIAGGLITGGGRLTGNVTLSLTNVPVANVTGAVPNTVNVIAGTGLSGGGALTGNVTINIANTAVVAGTYGNATAVAQVVVDAQGRITSAGNVTIAIGNSNLQNSNVIVGNTTLTLGSTVTSIGNLTLTNTTISSVASTFPNSFLTNSTATLGNATITLGGTTSSVGNLTLSNVTVSSGNVTANVSLTNATNASATFATSSLPLVPAGYLKFQLANSTVVLVPYYAQ